MVESIKTESSVRRANWISSPVCSTSALWQWGKYERQINSEKWNQIFLQYKKSGINDTTNDFWMEEKYQVQNIEGRLYHWKFRWHKQRIWLYEISLSSMQRKLKGEEWCILWLQPTRVEKLCALFQEVGPWKEIDCQVGTIILTNTSLPKFCHSETLVTSCSN